MIHAHWLLDIQDRRLVLKPFLMKRALWSLDLRLKLFLLYFIICLLVELHEVGIDRQVLKAYNHLRLPTKVELLLLVCQIHAGHIIEFVDIIRVVVVWIMLYIFIETRYIKALIIWEAWVDLLGLLLYLTLPTETSHLKVKALLLLVLVLARLELGIRRTSCRIFVLR